VVRLNCTGASYHTKPVEHGSFAPLVLSEDKTSPSCYQSALAARTSFCLVHAPEIDRVIGRLNTTIGHFIVTVFNGCFLCLLVNGRNSTPKDDYVHPCVSTDSSRIMYFSMHLFLAFLL